MKKRVTKFTGKHLSQSLFFNLVCNFIKKESLAQVLSCKFCEISKNTFFTEHLWTTASFIFMTNQIILGVVQRNYIYPFNHDYLKIIREKNVYITSSNLLRSIAASYNNKNNKKNHNITKNEINKNNNNNNNNINNGNLRTNSDG